MLLINLSNINLIRFSLLFSEGLLFLCLGNEAEVTGDLAANFLEVFQLAFEFLSGLSFFVELCLQLRDVSSSTHVAYLWGRWLDLGSWLENFGHFADLVLGLLSRKCFINCSFFWLIHINLLKISVCWLFFYLFGHCLYWFHNGCLGWSLWLLR